MKDNQLLVAIAKERLTRVKRHGCAKNDFDTPCIEYCLQTAGISIDQVDLIVQNSVFPFLSDPLYYSSLEHYKGSHGTRPRPFDLARHPNKIISHHLAHAYASYYLSDFDHAAILVVDSMGNEDNSIKDFYTGEDREFLIRNNYQPLGGWERESSYYAQSNEVVPLYKRFERDARPYNSLTKGFGLMYHEITEYIFGNGHLAGETMGLAPYGESTDSLNAVVFDHNSYHFRDDWLLELRRPHLEGQNWDGRFHEFSNLAAKCQRELEGGMIKLCCELYEKTKAKNLCLSGGVALNSVCNAKLLTDTPFERIFVPPAAGDSGIALGCALWGYHYLGGKKGDITFKNDYLGREYSDGEIRSALDHANLQYRHSDLITADAARLCVDGKIVGWFQGGSEFGPRALGNRSILCDARRLDIKDILNSRVKFRQPFRPFAPSILAEFASDYFELPQSSPYMLLVAPVRHDKRDIIPAVVHVDGSSRVQTVTPQQNPRFHNLIRTFYEMTGVPVILNTSFNVKGEPIVETPEDAIRCFSKTDMDFLCIGDFLTWK